MKWLKNILAGLVLLIATLLLTQFMSGKATEQYLYQNTTQLNVVYDANRFDYQKFIKTVEDLKKNNITVSQYNFTSEKSLMIYTNNPAKFKGNQRGEMAIKTYPFKAINNIGIGTVFYIRGNAQKVVNELSQFGQVSASPMNQANITNFSVMTLVVGLFLIILLVILIVILIQNNKKMILIQKTLGYGGLESLKVSINQNKWFIISLLMGGFVGVIVGRVSGFNLPLKFYGLLWLAIGLLTLLVVMFQASLFLIYYHFVGFEQQQQATKKGWLLILMLVFSVFIALSFQMVNPIVTSLNKVQTERRGMKQWQATKNLYKTNVTNQLNRDNQSEEQAYIKKAEAYYHQISRKKRTFIMSAHNFSVMEIDATTKLPVYIGQRTMPNETLVDYITNPFGNSVMADTNYLKRQKIKINDPHFYQHQFDGDIVYLLVPEKYQRYDPKIIENYTSDAKAGIKYRRVPQFKIVHTANQQAYFTYNVDLGNPDSGNQIVDPIVVVFNQHLVDQQTFGNLITVDGGLFYQTQDGAHAFDSLLPTIKQVGLSNTLNASISVYQAHSQYLATLKATLLNGVLNLILLILIDSLLVKELITFFIELNQKRLVVKWVLGYPKIALLVDSAFWPILIILGIAVGYQIIAFNIANFALAIFLIVISLLLYEYLLMRLLRRNQPWSN